MHAIRRAARRNAWYGDPEVENTGERTYNPFTRTRVRSDRRADVEQQRWHPETADDAVSLDDRILQHTNVDELKADFQAPQRSQTFPFSGTSGTAVSTETDTEHEKVVALPSSTETLDESGSVSMSRTNFPRRRKFGQFVKKTTIDHEDEDTKKKKKMYPKLSLVSQVKAIFGSWTTLLLVFVPTGFAVNYTNQSAVLIFIINFLAIIPSITIIGFTIENINMYIGDTAGALLSMTFSNAVQLISSIFLLKSRQIGVLRSSLLGGILQSLLIMTGLAFLIGGWNRTEQYFNAQLAQTIGMLLLLAVLSLMVPTVSQLWNHSSQAGIIAQSRGTAVVIIVSYILWLVFQLKTHRDMFNTPSEKAPKKPSGKKDAGAALRGIAAIGAASGAATAGGRINQENLIEDLEEEEDTPNLSRSVALVFLVIFTVLLAFNTQFATDSVQGIMTEHRISEEFMGIVVLPLLSNDPLTIDSAVKDKMDISISLTLERCMQTALMVVPLIVLLAWMMGIDEMTLDFDGFSVAALFASIIIVTYVVQEGRSNWLTGALLLKVFIIIGLASFYIENQS